MNLNAKTLPKLSALALCLASACLLPACGGGSAGGMVQTSPPPLAPPPPPPPPPPGPTEPCAPPITGHCHVAPPYTLTWDEIGMTGGRQSDYSLFVSGPGWLNLREGEYRFSGGTEIAGGTLVVWDTLISDVTVAKDYTGLGPMPIWKPAAGFAWVEAN